MRKKSMRLVSAALAACMMLSVLPVGAFAAEPGAAEQENGVSTQAAVYHLVGGETIDDDFIAQNGSSYSMSNAYTESGEYTKNIIIDTTKDVTIEVTGDINYNVNNSRLWHVKKVNDLTIKNNGHTVQVDSTRYIQILREEYNAQVGKITVDGGTYKGGTDSVFQFSSGGKADLKNVTVEGNSNNAVYSNRSCEVTITGGKYTTGGDVTISNCGTGTMNIYGGTFEGNQAIQNKDGTMLIDKGATIIGTFGVYHVVVNYGNGKLTFKDGTVEIKGGSPRAALCGWNNSETIVNGGTFKGAEYGVGVGLGTPRFTLTDATFEGNKNDIYLAQEQTITIGESFTDHATVDVGENTITAPRPITTSSNPVKRNLVSNRAGYRVAYDESDGHYYLTPRTAGKFTVDAEDAKAVAEIDGVSTELDANTEIAKDTRVDLTAVAPGAGWEFIGWELKVAGEDKTTELLQDADTENPWFTMPEGNVTVRALYNFVGTGDAGGSGPAIGGAIAAGIVTGAAAWGVYEAGTGIYRVINMPGIAMPSNRIELALLVWEHADKPEPQNMTDENLYADIDADDTDAQKAAHWAVEQDLMKDDADNNKFHPAFPVSKLRVCLTWNAAKEKGLFAKTEE